MMADAGKVPAAESGGIRRVGQVSLTVKSVARARDFYRDVLGLRHLFDAPPAMSFFDVDGLRLLLGEVEEDGAGAGSSILYLDVADIRAAARALEMRGVVFERAAEKVADLGDRELWLAFFRDSEGNMLALMSEVPVAR